MEIIRGQNIWIKFKVGVIKRTSLYEKVVGMLRIRSNKKNVFWALRGVSFTLGRGETLGIIGRNGSGKSTLLRVIAGIYKPDRGSMRVRGKMSTLLSITAGFQPDLSGMENIYLSGILLGMKKKEIDKIAKSIIDFSELGDFIALPVKTYSSGMKARLGFSISANMRGDILIIDEVLGVGDAKFNQKSRQKMQGLLSAGKTIVLASHNMDMIRQFSTHVLWLNKGRVAAFGPPDEVVPQYLKS